MKLEPDWFIPPRLRRAQRIIELLPPKSPGIGRHTFLLKLRAEVDGPREEHAPLLKLLGQLGLLHEKGTNLWLSKEGQRAKSLNSENARREMAQALLTGGYLHSQVRRVIEACAVDADGSAQALTSTLRHAAPQALGLLRAWPDAVGASTVTIPSTLYANLGTPWSLIPLPTPDDGPKKATGSRGEAYSYHLLRQESTPSEINWVALDDDALGYDIEDRTQGLTRIEVKASQQAEIRFFLTENEHKVAHTDPSTYVVHFWGDINLRRRPDAEYPDLRKRGYPIVFQDVAAHLDDGRLVAAPTRFRVTKPTAVPVSSAQ